MDPAFATRHGLLYQTDCLQLFATIKDASFDCIFADPPFNLGKVYGKGEVNDALAKRDYLKWSQAWLDEAVRVLKPGGALFVDIIPQWGYQVSRRGMDSGGAGYRRHRLDQAHSGERIHDRRRPGAPSVRAWRTDG